MARVFRCSIILFISLTLFSGIALAKDLIVKQPPASLDKLYPPQSKEPKWIQQMHKMSGSFGGVFVNMKEGDWVNAEKKAQAFAKVYEETSKLIPEWKDYFDLKAVKEFAATVKSHDPAKIGKASAPVGKTCGKCHGEQSVAVWTRYHWPKVDKINITDPVTDKEFKYGKFMHQISGSFYGVTVNFGEGQYDRSAKALRGFKKRYMELKSTCSKCHTNDGVKQFFVGPPIAKAFDNLKKELAADKPNPGVFWKNIGTIGKLGCKKCHLTHRSYAIIQENWEAK